jgi:hypothetical protein
MLACACLAWGQRPSDAESAALRERARLKALDYTRSLPDFVCRELVHRSSDRGAGWRATDTLTVRLSYSQHAEAHKLELIDGKPTDRKYEELNGATGTGEFGGVLREIFDPNSQAAFEWQSWKTVRKRRAAVYEYAISAAHSPYYLKSDYGKGVVGIHGVVEIDAETAEVLHVTFVAYEIPPELNLLSAANSVDYEFADVGGRQYLLPARSETEIHSPTVRSRNKIEFHDYRKFSAESVIDFGTGKQ